MIEKLKRVPYGEHVPRPHFATELVDKVNEIAAEVDVLSVVVSGGPKHCAVVDLTRPESWADNRLFQVILEKEYAHGYMDAVKDRVLGAQE